MAHSTRSNPPYGAWGCSAPWIFVLSSGWAPVSSQMGEDTFQYRYHCCVNICEELNITVYVMRSVLGVFSKRAFCHAHVGLCILGMTWPYGLVIDQFQPVCRPPDVSGTSFFDCQSLMLSCSGGGGGEVVAIPMHRGAAPRPCQLREKQIMVNKGGLEPASTVVPEHSAVGSIWAVSCSVDLYSYSEWTHLCRTSLIRPLFFQASSLAWTIFLEKMQLIIVFFLPSIHDPKCCISLQCYTTYTRPLAVYPATSDSCGLMEQINWFLTQTHTAESES